MAGYLNIEERGFKVDGTEVITSSRVLQNIASASIAGNVTVGGRVLVGTTGSGQTGANGVRALGFSQFDAGLLASKTRIIPTTTALKPGPTTTIDLVVTFPQAASRIICEFRGIVQDAITWNSISCLRIPFRILKLTNNTANANVVLGDWVELPPNTLGGIRVQSVAVQGATATTATIRVTMDQATSSNLVADGELIATEVLNRISSAAWSES